jgi:phage/plasmid-associated DNA primase
MASGWSACLTSEHAMLFFHGAGANGKSVLVSTIAGILGEYHRVAPIDTFTATGFSRHSAHRDRARASSSWTYRRGRGQRRR